MEQFYLPEFINKVTRSLQVLCGDQTIEFETSRAVVWVEEVGTYPSKSYLLFVDSTQVSIGFEEEIKLTVTMPDYVEILPKEFTFFLTIYSANLQRIEDIEIETGVTAR